jgi:eukaryotic-like serine/threonine-protein kinase
LAPISEIDAAGGFSPATVTSPAMTIQGVVLGTAAYMSPEQARGRPVDRRSDIWAFGVVLYEMLAGRTMFASDTVSDTIAAVLTREPSLDALPFDTPAAVRRVLQRCLQKDPARRFQHIADARLDLESAGTEPAPRIVPTAPASRRRWWWPAIAGAAVASLIAAAAAWAVWSRPAAAPRRYSFVVANAGFNTVSYAAISQDGKWIAYSPNQHAPPFRLLVRPLDGFDAREITAGPNTGFNPFFRPMASGSHISWVKRCSASPCREGRPNVWPPFFQERPMARGVTMAPSCCPPTSSLPTASAAR